MRVNFPYKIAMITILALMDNLAWGDVLPGAAMPDTIRRSLMPQRRQVTPEALPPIVSTPEPSATPGGEEAKKIKFVLHGIILQGNRVYSNQILELLYKKKLHTTINVSELFQIVQDITNFYRNNGYILSRAILPPQHVKGGVVKIQVIEGYIDKVAVTGNPKWAKCLLLGMAEQIKACPPLRINNMERYLFLANEVPGTQVRAVLSPSKTKTGAADLSLQTEQRMLSGYFSYDTYGTRYIGPQQMTANLQAYSFARSGDMGQVTVTKTPKGEELTFIDLNYTFPVNDEGMRWMFGATRAQTHPLFVLEPTDTQGLNTNYYTLLSFPMIRERSQSLTLQAGFGYSDSHVTQIGEELYTDHLRNLGGGVNYNFADRFLGANSMYAELRQGLPILGYTSDTSPTAQTSRPGGRGDYTKVSAQFSRLQSLKGNFNLYLTARAQYAFNPLLASEQFTYGGSQLGRGYDVAELIGDKGAAGSVELRYDLNIGKVLQSIQFYAFYDGGMIWNYVIPGAVNTTPQISATSAGAGARFSFTKYISGNVFWAQPLTKEVAAEELIGDGWRPRVFFSLVMSL